MSEDASAAIAAASIKVPAFTTHDPELFFMSLESQFHVRKCTHELTKFHYVIGALPEAILVKVKDLIRTPPTDMPYQTLKTRLADTFQRSPDEKMRRSTRPLSMADI